MTNHNHLSTIFAESENLTIIFYTIGEDRQKEVVVGRRGTGRGSGGLREAGCAERGVRGDGAGGARRLQDLRRAQVGAAAQEGHRLAQGVRIRRVPGGKS